MPYPEENESFYWKSQKYKSWIFEISQQSDEKTLLGIIKKHDGKCNMLVVSDGSAI